MSQAVRHFRTLRDVDPTELRELLEIGYRLKRGEAGQDRPLAGRSLAMIFRKHSTRTRVSFDVGMYQLGGHAIDLPASQSHLARGEPTADTAKVLSGYVDAIMIRTYEQEEVEGLARHGSVPVINGLTDLVHPCQLLADLLTLKAHYGVDFERRVISWVGDGNNMANSWLNAAAMLGFELRLAVPEGYDPDPDILARASSETSVTLTRDPVEAVDGADVVCTDTWASMGQDDQAAVRAEAFRAFQVTSDLMNRAASDAVFLHCLPAHRGEEVTEEVIDGPRSLIYDEAENRLHAQKALLLFLLAE